MTRIQRGMTREVRHTRGEAETGGCGRGVSRHLRLVKRISLGPGKNNIVRAVFTQVLLLAVISSLWAVQIMWSNQAIMSSHSTIKLSSLIQGYLRRISELFLALALAHTEMFL